MTFLVGYSVSFILDKLDVAGEKRIYLDADKKVINTDLFAPPVAKRLKNQIKKYLENGGPVEICHTKNETTIL